MQAQNSNVNFGMAFRSRSKSAMLYFKKYIANKIERTNKRYNNCGKFIGRNDLNE